MAFSTYYHYTDEAGKKAIEKSKKLKKSGNGAMGPGVYLTQVTPDNKKQEIANNNYDGVVNNDGHLGDIQMANGRVDYVIKVKVKDGTATKAQTKERDVHCIKDKDLDLEDGDLVQSWEVQKV